MQGKSGKLGGGLPFWKVEGAGNDFVLLDYRKDAGPRMTAPIARFLLDRHRGIGGDGLLVIRQGSTGPYVDYRNADGGTADFCGNGARCAAHHILGEDEGPIRFHFMKIELDARKTEFGIAARVGHAEDRSMPNLTRLRPRPAALVLAGVDHWIVPVGDVQALDIVSLGQVLRRHPWPGPGGANVTFVEKRRNEIRIRTYERGVEGETLSCGSGCVAAAHWALDGETGPLNVHTRGGDVLRVWRDASDQYWLEGTVRVVYTGVWPMTAAKAKRGAMTTTTKTKKKG